MRYRTELQLLDATKEKWDIYKSIEIEIVNIAEEHGVKIIKSIYDDESFIKTIYLDKDNDVDDKNLLLNVGNLLGRYDIKPFFISTIEVIANRNKILYTIELINPTLEKWYLYKSIESHLNKHADEEKVILENIKYNDKDYTVSMVVSYPSDLARANMNNRMTLCLKSYGLEVKYLDANEFKDYSNDVIDLPLYNLNKLMDQAKQSLGKLSDM
jgi:hypothetical protein